VLRRLFPNVRRIVATLDPTMIIAERWARATGADLWVYGIDLHASAFWGAGPFLQKTLARWRRQTLGRASRCFGLSPAHERMDARGRAPAEVELLPPLINIDAAGPVPLPTGRRSLLFVGWLYTAQGQALAWLQKAVTEIAPDIELRLLTHMAPADVAAMGLDPARWSIKSVPPEQVLQEVASSTCMIAALDPVAHNRAPLQVIWPTKLREYLSVGRPVLVIAPPDYGIVDIATQGGWGLVAHDETIHARGGGDPGPQQQRGSAWPIGGGVSVRAAVHEQPHHRRRVSSRRPGTLNASIGTRPPCASFTSILSLNRVSGPDESLLGLLRHLVPPSERFGHAVREEGNLRKASTIVAIFAQSLHRRSNKSQKRRSHCSSLFL